MEADALLELRRAQSAVRQLSIEKQELERKKSELDVQVRKHQSSAKEAKDAEEAAAISLAQIRSRQFARAIQSTLPQELRDKIYEHLWHEAGIRRDLQHFLLLEVGCGKKHPLDDLPRSPLPHFALPEYMGAAMADEILAHSYKDLFARLSQKVPMEDLAEVLTSDLFARGFRIIDWIRSLKINWTWIWGDRKNERAVSRALKIISEHTFARSITVNITMSSYSASSSSWPNIIDQLRAFQSTYKALISKGHAITIKENGRDMDMTEYYTMSEEAWHKKMNATIREALSKQTQGWGLSG